MSRSYERLPVLEFGSRLIQSGDLDPLYIALNRSDLDKEDIKRLLVAYWCTYHVGQSAWLAEREGGKFFEGLAEIAHNATEAPVGGRWPRGKERRHWRGQQAISSALALANRYERPEDMVDYVSQMATDDIYLPFELVNRRVQEHRGFGDWIAFKVGDMLETCLGVPVTFEQAEIFMFKDPAKAATMVFREMNPDIADRWDAGAFTISQEEINKRVTRWMSGQFMGHREPARKHRAVGLQEVETILCKWKSHMNGHYPVGNDITEIREGLEPWAKVSEFAEHLISCMPEKVQ